MKKEHEYIESSIWYKEEISDPYQVIAEFFSPDDLNSNRKIIKDLLFAANSEKIYKKDAPGDLLFHMKLFESLINAAYLINQEKKKSPLEIPNYELFNPNLYRGWERDSTDWDFLPRTLSLKEYKNPYGVFIDCLSIYLYMTKLIEAAHLIDVRETYHIGGMIKNRMKTGS